MVNNYGTIVASWHITSKSIRLASPIQENYNIQIVLSV